MKSPHPDSETQTGEQCEVNCTDDDDGQEKEEAMDFGVP
jgi:hypothetical protein